MTIPYFIMGEIPLRVFSSESTQRSQTYAAQAMVEFMDRVRGVKWVDFIDKIPGNYFNGGPANATPLVVSTWSSCARCDPEYFQTIFLSRVTSKTLIGPVAA